MKKTVILILIIFILWGCNSKNTINKDIKSSNISDEIDYGDRNELQINSIKKANLYLEETKYVEAYIYYSKGDYLDSDNALECKDELIEGALKEIKKDNMLESYGMDNLYGEFLYVDEFILDENEMALRFSLHIEYKTDYGYMDVVYIAIVRENNLGNCLYTMHQPDYLNTGEYNNEPSIENLVIDYQDIYDLNIDDFELESSNSRKYIRINGYKDYDDGPHKVTISGYARYNLNNGTWLVTVQSEKDD